MGQLDPQRAAAVVETTGRAVGRVANGIAPGTVLALAMQQTLRHLAASDGYWRELSGCLTGPDAASELARVRTAAAAWAPAASDGGRAALYGCGLRAAEADAVLDELAGDARRESAVRAAFDAADPAETARLLTTISANDRPDRRRAHLARRLAYESGKMTVGYIVLMSALMAVIGLVFSTCFTPAYKGISPA